MNFAPTLNRLHKRNRPDGRGVSLLDFFSILAVNAKASL